MQLSRRQVSVCSAHAGPLAKYNSRLTERE